jgi:hypothetical protein
MAVEEFTEAGVLVPSDRMSWTGSEDLEEGLSSEGWTVPIANSVYSPNPPKLGLWCKLG